MRILLKDKYPDIRSQWDYDRNPGIDPDTLTVSNGTRCWWHCQHGHPSWLATVSYRTHYRKYGCPYCDGRRAIPGQTDLATLYPDIAVEYADDLNDDDAITVSPSDARDRWWRCANGHTWLASPRTRTLKHTGCRYCSNRYAWPGFNDLESQCPKVAAEFNADRNGTTADRVVYDSHKRMWWVCANGHEWSDEVRARTIRHTQCPQCHGVYVGYGNRVVPGVDDLFSLHPELVDYWNEDMAALGTISPSSNHQYHWRCVSHADHEWVESPRDILRRRSGVCPYCCNARILPGFNDLGTTNPELAAEWDDDRNVLEPSVVFPCSDKVVWWRCPHGHSWSTPVYSRTLSGTGCPVCASGASSSRGEVELRDYVKSIVPHAIVLGNDRTVLHGRELDVYVPEHHIAMEYDGLYWHSEDAGRDKGYHQRKTDDCAAADISLVHVWEDDWRDRRAIIEDMIAYRMHAGDRRYFSARSLVLDMSVDAGAMRGFMNANHIQGMGHGSVRVGLRDGDGMLVAGMVLSVDTAHDGLVLDRYATVLGASVRGGFTRLLHHVIMCHHPHRITTFSDHGSFDGGLYSSSGFHVDGELPPDYSYIIGAGDSAHREHKFNYRKARFRDDPNLSWRDGATESELARLNGLPRVWDAGKTRWVMAVG